MDGPIAAALLLMVAAFAAAAIEHRGYHFISPLSQTLFVPLILGGTIAGLLEIYCWIKIAGWRDGLIIWVISSIICTGIMIKIRWSAPISVIGIVSMLVGAYLFWVFFV